MLYKYTVVFLAERPRLETIVSIIAPKNILSLKEDREVTKIMKIDLDPATLQERRGPILEDMKEGK